MENNFNVIGSLASLGGTIALNLGYEYPKVPDLRGESASGTLEEIDADIRGQERHRAEADFVVAPTEGIVEMIETATRTVSEEDFRRVPPDLAERSH
jgi:hypothetical protein